MIEDRLLDAAEAAELLNVPLSWVRDQTRRDLLPHVRLGRYRRYSRPALLAWLAELETGGANENATRR